MHAQNFADKINERIYMHTRYMDELYIHTDFVSKLWSSITLRIFCRVIYMADKMVLRKKVVCLICVGRLSILDDCWHFPNWVKNYSGRESNPVPLSYIANALPTVLHESTTGRHNSLKQNYWHMHLVCHVDSPTIYTAGNATPWADVYGDTLLFLNQ